MPETIEDNPILKRLRDFAPDAIDGTQLFRGELTVHIHRENLRQVCECLRDDAELTFKYLSDLTAVDHYPNEPRFETVYHLYSIERNERLRLKVRLAGDNPQVDSVVPVWPGANAFEREVFDLFGVYFVGHPYLVRILMPEDWEGYPLRKDYPTEGYRF
ncbi:MAG TPA: NADH-quinone oxidoreductase subunit C [Terriglobia bacterium]|nr:NADH-quinone oxidoreductase subunit C [Terriglobia bacterium]